MRELGMQFDRCAPDFRRIPHPTPPPGPFCVLFHTKETPHLVAPSFSPYPVQKREISLPCWSLVNGTRNLPLARQHAGEACTGASNRSGHHHNSSGSDGLLGQQEEKCWLYRWVIECGA